MNYAPINMNMNDFFLNFLLIFCVIMTLFSLYMMFRNYQVHKEVTKVRKKIFEKDDDGNYKRDSSSIIELIKRQKEIATHGKMVIQFWKKPDSFFEEFLEELDE